MDIFRGWLRQPQLWYGLSSFRAWLRGWRRIGTRFRLRAARLRSFLPQLEPLENRQMPSLSGITEYAIPTANSGAQGIAYGPDGNLWFVENATNKIAKVTPTGTITEYTVTTANSHPYDIANGPDGNLWFSETSGNKIAKITTSGAITEYSIPTAASAPHGLTKGPDGNVWFVESATNKVGYVTTSGTFTEYSITGASGSLNTEAIATGSDGNLWFTEPGGGPTSPYIGKVTTGGTFSQYALAMNTFPEGITAGPDGNLWYVELTSGKVARITTSGTITEFSLPSSSAGLHRITAGANNDLWVAEFASDKIAEVDAASGTVTEYPAPTGASAPWGIALGPGQALWFTESANAANNVAKYLWTPGSGVPAPLAPYSLGPVSVSPMDGNATLQYPLFLAQSTPGPNDPPLPGALVYNSNSTGYQPIIYSTYLNNRSTSFFDAAGNLTGVKDNRGNLTQYLIDGDNRATVTVDALSDRSTSFFDAAGNLTGTKDANGNLTQYLFDADNRASVTIDALSKRTTSFFDGAGNLTGSKDANGNLTQYLFDADNRASVTIDALNNRATSFFDAAGNLTGSKDANGNLTQFLLDALNRQTVTIDADTNRSTSLFDAAGNLTGVLDGRGDLTQYLYDLDNRQYVVVDALSKRTTSLFDAAGNVTQVTDPNKDATKYLYDALNRQTVVIDALNNRTTSFLDAAGNVIAVKDADNNTTTFGYDALNRKTGETDPFNHLVTYLYDAGGRLTQITDRIGQIRDISYDADNRESGETWIVSNMTQNTLTFTYDSVGNMLTASNNNGTYTMSYDALGRATVVNDMWGNALTFFYDSVGHRTQVQDNFGGVLTSLYDAAGNLTSVQLGGAGPLRMDLAYNADNQIASETRYTDLLATTKVASSTFSYDVDGRSSSITHQNFTGTSLASFSYLYDAAGRLTSATQNSIVTNYGYDATNQLLGDGTTTVTLDATGNRNNGGYIVGTWNELSSDGTYNYNSDNEGNVLEKTKISDGSYWLYSYDAENHLTQVSQYNVSNVLLQTVAFKYDAFGNRIEKDVTTTSTVTIHFALDGWNPAKAGTQGNANFDVWADLNGSNGLTTRYLRGDAVDQLFARIDSGTAYWELMDYQGSIRTIIDNSANVKDQITYDGWGNATQTASTFGGRYLYVGRDFDSETGLQYNRARYYDPKTSRWISQDPLGFDGGDVNLYRYAGNAPPNSTDPSGLFGGGPTWSTPMGSAPGGGQLYAPSAPGGNGISGPAGGLLPVIPDTPGSSRAIAPYVPGEGQGGYMTLPGNPNAPQPPLQDMFNYSGGTAPLPPPATPAGQSLVPDGRAIAPYVPVEGPGGYLVLPGNPNAPQTPLQDMFNYSGGIAPLPPPATPAGPNLVPDGRAIAPYVPGEGQGGYMTLPGNPNAPQTPLQDMFNYSGGIAPLPPPATPAGPSLVPDGRAIAPYVPGEGQGGYMTLPGNPNAPQTPLQDMFNYSGGIAPLPPPATPAGPNLVPDGRTIAPYVPGEGQGGYMTLPGNPNAPQTPLQDMFNYSGGIAPLPPPATPAGPNLVPDGRAIAPYVPVEGPGGYLVLPGNPNAPQPPLQDMFNYSGGIAPLPPPATPPGFSGIAPPLPPIPERPAPPVAGLGPGGASGGILPYLPGQGGGSNIMVAASAGGTGGPSRRSTSAASEGSSHVQSSGNVGRAATANPVAGSLDNIQARDWYNVREAELRQTIQQWRAEGRSPEEIARMAHAQRNVNRDLARALMADRLKAAELARDFPTMTWEQVMARYGNDFEKIIGASTRTSAEVNQYIEQLRALQRAGRAARVRAMLAALGEAAFLMALDLAATLLAEFAGAAGLGARHPGQSYDPFNQVDPNNPLGFDTPERRAYDRFMGQARLAEYLREQRRQQREAERQAMREFWRQPPVFLTPEEVRAHPLPRPTFP